MSEQAVVEQVAPVAPATPEVVAEVVKNDQNAPNEAAEKEEEPPKTDGQPEKQGKSRFERRLDRAYRQRAEAQAEAKFYREREQAREQAAREQSPSGLKIEDFDYDPQKFAEAVRKQERETAEREVKQRQETERRTVAERALSETWTKHVITGEDKYEDFHEVVGELKPNSPWTIAVMGAENAADVAYYLGTHLDETQKIIALDPISQIRAIGRLEAKLLAEPAKKKVTAAPAPIKPVEATFKADTGEPDPSDTKKWIAWRSKQVHDSH